MIASAAEAGCVVRVGVPEGFCEGSVRVWM